MQGRIIKGVAGFYDVYTSEEGVIRCKPRGIFRKEGQKPLVGDLVEIQILDEEDREGSLDSIYPRRSQLSRPEVSNVDQAVVIMAMQQPEPDLVLLDRLLVIMASQSVPVLICFNKTDLAEPEQLKYIEEIYRQCGADVLFVSTVTRESMEEFCARLLGKTSVVAGPSGVGKSSIVNLLQTEVSMEIGELSRKLKRGKNTTRHSQMVAIDSDTYVIDTPGFSSLFLQYLEKEELKNYYAEFQPYKGQCRFFECTHTHEPDCAVKAAVESGEIHPVRYRNYQGLYRELKEQRRY